MIQKISQTDLDMTPAGSETAEGKDIRLGQENRWLKEQLAEAHAVIRAFKELEAQRKEQLERYLAIIAAFQQLTAQLEEKTERNALVVKT